MSDVSREAIEYFNKRIEVEKKIISLPTCDKEVAAAKGKHIDYMQLAIADRQKIEKIEQIINTISSISGDGFDVKAIGFDKIEQIIKGNDK